ncbi:glycosyl hydrolase family protein [Acidobacteria bacterium AB60]|nr:glycosyl hydrolase family protein [Acidobacteria bacterium AB60]
MLCACGGGASAGTTTTAPAQQAATPAITTTPSQNGAVVVSLSDTTSGATIYYTLDGSTPDNTSQVYQAPFVVASNLTVKAMAANAPAYTNSNVATQALAPSVAAGALVWSDEFNNPSSTNQPPNASVWTYDLGTNCCGNNELETYCAPSSNAAPCSSSSPNAFVGTDGNLHIVAMQPTAGVKTYTSARLKSQGLVSFLYGRIEARMKLPESQGMWPAFWMLGNNITKVSWPACGELDIMEHIDGSNPPFSVGSAAPGYDWIAGSVHGGTTAAHADGTEKYHPAGFSAAAWHTYGMIWSTGQVQFYVDNPTNVYATYTPSTFPGPWPFDQGPQFVILNLAVGGDWPGSPDASTVFPSEMVVDYVRVYKN